MFDFVNNIIENLQKNFKEKEIGEIIYASITGSHLHGTSSSTSDIDVKGIFIPSLKSLVNQDYKNSHSYIFQNENIKYETTLISIQEFLNKVLRMECNTIELLFSNKSDVYRYQTSISDELLNVSKELLTNNVTSFLGMAQAEIDRYKTNKNRNTSKDIAHGIRSVQCAREFLNSGKIDYPLNKAETIKKIKYGTTPCNDAYNALLNIMSVVENPKEKPSEHQIMLRRQILEKFYNLS